MIRSLIAALMLVLAACTSTTSSPSADGSASSASATAEPTAQPTPSATASASPEASGDESDNAEPSNSQNGGEPGGFAFSSNAEADDLMLDRFSCQNLDEGYEVDFPAEWNANAEIGGVPPCSWFAPTEYSAGSGTEVPDEVAIEVFIVDGERTYGDAETEDRAEGYIGVTQPAFRVTVEDGDETSYEYVVQLGPTPEEGPNLVARTSSEMGGDFDLNRAVLDRMMSTMEFIGTMQ